MKLRYFETNKSNIYGDDEKLLCTKNRMNFYPQIGALVMVDEESYRVIDLCFESDFETIDVMMIPDEE